MVCHGTTKVSFVVLWLCDLNLWRASGLLLYDSLEMREAKRAANDLIHTIFKLLSRNGRGTAESIVATPEQLRRTQDQNLS